MMIEVLVHACILSLLSSSDQLFNFRMGSILFEVIKQHAKAEIRKYTFCLQDPTVSKLFVCFLRIHKKFL